ncbi:disks large-associated protein 3 [Hypomesus transpacificus]|uniref:disks large-associated protein 3 n=1 Tax=Hypomesus transpacificus TaxID=137520 RepID=UPI001F0729BC|nr:disks large-associated protein 3 [Hypomesus transpacificus]
MRSHASRSLSQHSSGGGPCHCMPEDGESRVGRDYHHHHPSEHYQDQSYYPPGGPPEPLALKRHHAHSGGGTFPRSHPSQHPPLQGYDSCEECLTTVVGPGGKVHRIPPGLLEQFEKQLPFQPDGFHTLQYQRSASGEQRSESPSRIRHLVHSVQRLFAKSHSLEAPSKREPNGTRGGGGEYRGGHRSGGEEGGGPGHQSRSARRCKSRERSRSGDSRHESGRRHRSRTAGWWSSDDNLDSDSSFLVTGGPRGGRGYLAGHESLDSAIQELTLKKPRGEGGGGGGGGGGGQGALPAPAQGECMACTSMMLAGGEGGGASLKRSTWSAMTVSQAREVYPPARGGALDKALVPMDNKMKERNFHYLQVPSDEWGVFPGEIPCRRMRSGSYIKAMGDEDSGEDSPQASPQTPALPPASPRTSALAQRDAFRRSVSMDQRSCTPKSSCQQCTDSQPKSHGRSRSYTRSLTSSQLGASLSRQFEVVCESMFGGPESPAVEALDLPGSFRTRSHSYVRAIQAGCSQDDDCLSVFSMSGPQGSLKSGAVFPSRKGGPPPPLPPRMSKSSLSVHAQSSTESTQDAYFQSTGQPPPSQPPQAPQGSGPRHPRQHSNSVDLGGSEGPSSGRTSRAGAGYYTCTAPRGGHGRLHSNSAESLEGGSRELVPYAGGGTMRNRHSGSADSLLEGPGGRGGRGGRAGGSLGKASLPQNSVALFRSGGGGAGQEDGRGHRWRPSIAVQVDSSETLSDSEAEGLREVHSVGVQVEDDKRRARFRRSNSVTAAVQADLGPEGAFLLGPPLQDRGLQFSCSFQRHSSEPESAGQYAEYQRTVHTQGQWAYREGGYSPDSCPPLHPPLPPRAHSPLPLLSSLEGPGSVPDSTRASPCPREGEIFLRLLQTEVERMEGWCQSMEREAEDNKLPEEVLEQIRSAVGAAQMLMSQKVQQFFRLCQQSVDPSTFPSPSPQDLAACWDLLQLSMDDVCLQFQDLQRLKDSGWKLLPDKKDDNKPPPPLPKKPLGGVGGGLRADSVGAGLLVPRGGAGGGARILPLKEKSLDLPDTRRRLQTKRAASFRQNSATESADSIEIFIPEAQTRL